MEQIKERVINYLKTTKIPQGIENIRVACNIGNWNTALKHCLELLLQEKINGQKTSKSWIFWSKERRTSGSPEKLETVFER